MADEEFENLNDASDDEIVDQSTTEDEDNSEEDDTELDYKQLYLDQKIANTKLEHDTKSRKGAEVSQKQRDDVMFDIANRLTASEKATQALARAIASGDTDKLGTEIVEIEQESVRTQNATNFERQYQSLFNDMQDAVLDEDGTEILNLMKSPELADIRQEVVDAHKLQDIISISQAVAKIHKITRNIQRKTSQKVVEDEKETKKKQRKASGVGNHDLGAGRGKGSESVPVSAKNGLDRIKQGLKDQADK